MLYSALDKIITTGYKALQLQYFFTAGEDEVKAWTIQVCVICVWLVQQFYELRSNICLSTDCTVCLHV